MDDCLLLTCFGEVSCANACIASAEEALTNAHAKCWEKLAGFSRQLTHESLDLKKDRFLPD